MGRVIGENIILREFRSEDLSAMRGWVNDPDVTRYLSPRYYGRPQTWEQTEEYLRSILNGNSGGVDFVVAEKEKLRYMGQVSLFLLDYTARSAEMAIVLSGEHIGRGYGVEALRLLLKYAFEQMNLNRVYLTVSAENARAIRAYEKAGFVHEGCWRSARFADGHYQDVILMGILRDEYAACAEAEGSA